MQCIANSRVILNKSSSYFLCLWLYIINLVSTIYPHFCVMLLKPNTKCQQVYWHKGIEIYVFTPSLVIRGDKDERAVLCSMDMTYDLKIADTSNLLLFVPECRTPYHVTNSQGVPHVAHTEVWKWQRPKSMPCMSQKHSIINAILLLF